MDDTTRMTGINHKNLFMKYLIMALSLHGFLTGQKSDRSEWIELRD